MSALPKVIQDQVDQAEALQQQLYPVDSAPAEAEQPVAEPVAEQPSNVVELPKPQTAPEVIPREETVDYWKSRFETLRGKFDAEVPTLHHQLKEQSQQLQQLMEKFSEKQEPAPKEASLVTDKDVEDYGDDMISMVRRAAAQEVKQAVAIAIAELRKEFGAVQAQVGHVADRVVQSEADKFWGGVMTLVPEWKQIDNDPRWIEWLDTAPEFSEETYREIAGKAIQKHNAQKIAALVNTWKTALGLTQAPVQQAAAVQAELARQVAPSTSRASTPSQPGERIWSEADYKQAYDIRNVQRFGQKQADEMRAEADRAVAEGRVRW